VSFSQHRLTWSPIIEPTIQQKTIFGITCCGNEQNYRQLAAHQCEGCTLHSWHMAPTAVWNSAKTRGKGYRKLEQRATWQNMINARNSRVWPSGRASVKIPKWFWKTVRRGWSQRKKWLCANLTIKDKRDKAAMKIRYSNAGRLGASCWGISNPWFSTGLHRAERCAAPEEMARLGSNWQQGNKRRSVG